MASKVAKPYKIKGTTIVSNACEAEWCKYLTSHLQKSLGNQYTPRGEYSVNLLSDPASPEFQVFKAKIDNIIDTAYQEIMDDQGEITLGTSAKKKLNKVYPFKDHIIKEKDSNGKYTIENETGKVMVVPKMKNVLDKKEGNNYIKLIGDGNVEVAIDKRPEIGNGSIIKAKMYVNPYYMAASGSVGVSLSLDSIKLITLNSYGGGSGGEDFEDGDFEASVRTPEEGEDY